jgi:hypothetical protein
MEKAIITLEVPKAVYDLMLDVVDLVELIDEKLEDGFQPVEDGSAIVFSKEIIAAVKGLANYKSVLSAAKEDAEGSLVALMLGAKEALKKIKD